MDKGLDIAARRSVLAFHGAVNGDVRALRGDHAATESGKPPSALQLLRTLRAHGIVPRWDLADRALAWAAQPGRHLLMLGDDNYPRRLREIPTPPVVLFVEGDLATLELPQIAIVGSRRASPAGCEIARGMAAELTAAELAVTSGLAIGIDSAAHHGALAAGGCTIAVFGCGIDRIYPRQHQALAHAIKSCGALVSEFPLGAPPRKQHFPQRNRLISGLALGTLVIEAAMRSGSISTALHALEQGREVFAVPGSIRSPLSPGCHALIKQGAKLTEGVSDILDELPQPGRRAGSADARRDQHAARAQRPATAIEDARLLDACGWEAFTIDDVVARSGLTVQEVSSMLLPLELAGLIQVQATGSYMRIR